MVSMSTLGFLKESCYHIVWACDRFKHLFASSVHNLGIRFVVMFWHGLYVKLKKRFSCSVRGLFGLLLVTIVLKTVQSCEGAGVKYLGSLPLDPAIAIASEKGHSLFSRTKTSTGSNLHALRDSSTVTSLNSVIDALLSELGAA